MFDHLKDEELLDLLERSPKTDIPEPDWAEFRSSVRDRLLSRSVQRASVMRRWTGWPVRPQFAWALSLALAVGITTGAFLLQMQPDPATAFIAEQPVVEEAVWSQTALFDEVIQLDDPEKEQLRQMLESAQKGTQYLQ